MVTWLLVSLKMLIVTRHLNDATKSTCLLFSAYSVVWRTEGAIRSGSSHLQIKYFEICMSSFSALWLGWLGLAWLGFARLGLAGLRLASLGLAWLA